MLLTLMEEWGILGREGSCTATARCKGCRLQRFEKGKRETGNGKRKTDSVSRFSFPVSRACVYPMQRFRVLIRRQNRF
jgi:hypothetical protein